MRRRRKPPSKAKQIRELKEQLQKEQTAAKILTLQIGHIARISEGHKAELAKCQKQLKDNEKRDKTIRELMEKATPVEFFRVPSTRETYRCQVDFDGQFMGLLHSRTEQEFVADDVAERIRREIITSKFINTANNNRRRELDEEMKLRSQMRRPF